MSVCIEHNNFSQRLSISEKCLTYPKTHPSKLNLFKQLKVWVSRSKQRKQLAKLDERMLIDIGYTPSQVREEFTKPFWK